MYVWQTAAYGVHFSCVLMSSLACVGASQMNEDGDLDLMLQSVLRVSGELVTHTQRCPCPSEDFRARVRKGALPGGLLTPFLFLFRHQSLTPSGALRLP